MPLQFQFHRFRLLPNSLMPVLTAPIGYFRKCSLQSLPVSPSLDDVFSVITYSPAKFNSQKSKAGFLVLAKPAETYYPGLFFR